MQKYLCALYYTYVYQIKCGMEVQIYNKNLEHNDRYTHAYIVLGTKSRKLASFCFMCFA